MKLTRDRLKELIAEELKTVFGTDEGSEIDENTGEAAPERIQSGTEKLRTQLDTNTELKSGLSNIKTAEAVAQALQMVLAGFVNAPPQNVKTALRVLNSKVQGASPDPAPASRAQAQGVTHFGES